MTSDLLPSLNVFAVVLTGVALAWVVRLLLPAARGLTWSTTIVISVLGAAVAWVPIDLLAPTSPVVVHMAAGVIGATAAVAGTAAALIARERRRARGAPGRTVEQLIAEGEGERVERKATARWNTRSGAKDQRIEDEVAVTIAGFMNATGGTLLLGVADDGTIHGLGDDYAVVPGRDRDGFELWLRSMLGERLGRSVTADIGVAFVDVAGLDVCRVDVAPADRPVFVGSSGGGRTADFHVRIGNATRRMLADEMLEYVRRRWA